jgi:hypothetical protein
MVKGMTATFFWRVRKLPKGWQRDTWRFLYKNRLEARHWHVLEQDRVMLEEMEPDANQHENLYQHDLGIVRLRRHMRNLAVAQLAEEAGRPKPPRPERERTQPCLPPRSTPSCTPCATRPTAS